MLIPKIRTAAAYRAQAAHIREFIETVRDDDQLKAVLLDAAARLDRLAEDLDNPEGQNQVPERSPPAPK
jgi:hypothetical protein